MVLKTNIELSTCKSECSVESAEVISIKKKKNAENLNAYNIYVVVIYVNGRENKEC